jgi:hypothetical protein
LLDAGGHLYRAFLEIDRRVKAIAQSDRKLGARLSRSKGRSRAIVAVARKLAVALHTMWTDGTMYCNAQEALT